MKRKAPIDTRDPWTKVHQLFWGRRPDGSMMGPQERRALFLQLLQEHMAAHPDSNGWAINRKGCFSEKKDPDLKALLKAGKVTKHRVAGGHGTNTTYIKPAP